MEGFDKEIISSHYCREEQTPPIFIKKVDSKIQTFRFSFKMVHGEICEISDFHLIWKMHFSEFSKENCSIRISPNFKFMGHTWFIESELMPNELRFRLSGYFILCSNPFTLTYKIYLENFKSITRKVYFIGLVSEEFSYVKNYSTFLSCRELDFVQIKSMIDSGDEVSISLIFIPSENQQKEILSTDFNLSSSTADVGKQTCSELESKTICCCLSDGVDELLQNFKDLLRSGQRSDVTLNVKGTEIKAHRTILIARSPVFAKMFDHDMLEETTGSVQITDCEPEDFRAFLFYLYTGKVENPTVKSAVELCCLADKYNITGLGPYCVKFLLSNLSVESFCDIVTLGLRQCETLLINSANTFFVKNMKQIVCSDRWKIFSKENPDEANEILIKGFSKVKILPDSS